MYNKLILRKNVNFLQILKMYLLISIRERNCRKKKDFHINHYLDTQSETALALQDTFNGMIDRHRTVILALNKYHCLYPQPRSGPINTISLTDFEETFYLSVIQFL